MKTDRLLGILSILANTDKITVQELADRFEVSKRTIFRDLNALSCAGIPITSVTGYGGGVAVVEGYRPGRGILSREDTKNIFTALNGLNTAPGGGSVANLIAKLVPETPSDAFSQSEYMIDFSSWFSDSIIKEKADRLREAVGSRHIAELDYISRSGRFLRRVEPHKLIFKQSDWYLYAYCRSREEFRLFRLRRIASFKILEETFKPRPVNAIDFASGYGDGLFSAQTSDQSFEVVLSYAVSDEFRLTSAIDASFFVRCPSDPDRRGEIRFTASNLRAAADLVFLIIDKVQVISPTELADELRRRIKQIKF